MSKVYTVQTQLTAHPNMQAADRSSEEQDSGEALCGRCNFTDDDIVKRLKKKRREDEEKERRGREMKFEADESC